MADYNEAIRLDAEDPLVYDNRGNAHLGNGGLDRAIEDYGEASQVAEELQNNVVSLKSAPVLS